MAVKYTAYLPNSGLFCQMQCDANNKETDPMLHILWKERSSKTSKVSSILGPLSKMISPHTIRDWNSLQDSIISSAEGAEDGVAKFTPLVRARD